MIIRFLVFLSVIFYTSASIAAPPVSSLSKLFKSASTTRGSSVAGHAVDGYGAKGVEQLKHGDPLHKGSPSSIQSFTDPQANTHLEPIARSRNDAETYKVLRSSAEKGDTDAMVRLSEMSLSGKVRNTGEPYHAYWLAQAASLGNKVARTKLQSECSLSENKRRVDRWFDAACRRIDGSNLYGIGRATDFYPSYQGAPGLRLPDK